MNFVAIFCIIGCVVIILYDMIVTRILLYSSLYLNRESRKFDFFLQIKEKGIVKLAKKHASQILTAGTVRRISRSWCC